MTDQQQHAQKTLRQGRKGPAAVVEVVIKTHCGGFKYLDRGNSKKPDDCFSRGLDELEEDRACIHPLHLL